MKEILTPIRLMDTHLQLSEDTVAYGAVNREGNIVFTICVPADNKTIQHTASEAAKEIVRCVNSHDALVSALRGINAWALINARPEIGNLCKEALKTAEIEEPY